MKLELGPPELLDSAAKPLHYLPIYEKYLQGRKPKVIVEIGVHLGYSVEMWARNFPEALILGIDISLPENFLFSPNVVLLEGSQGDSVFLRRVISEHAPDGIDVVVDDGAHVGSLAQRTFATLFPVLKTNGLYFIEDWGTGYWEDWQDGVKPKEPISFDSDFRVQHVDGMVGLVKSFIDFVGLGDIPLELRGSAPPPQSLGVYRGMAVIEK